MATSTVENYIKQIFMEQQQCGQNLVPLGRLAELMNVVPGTVTTMVKALHDANLARYEPRQGVRLTPAGQKLALHVLRRHRLIELFLVRVLGFDWADVHAEAEELEHATSDKLLERIDEFLGRPAFDPHGDPIPSPGGKLSKSSLINLGDCHDGQQVRIARIADQNAEFLKFANEHGLVPGARVMVSQRDPAGEAMLVHVEGRKPLAIGVAVGNKIMVEHPAGKGGERARASEEPEVA
jgi:DtxR family transcriptional regulator, Mn-dependent transcriptional regulator